MRRLNRSGEALVCPFKPGAVVSSLWHIDRHSFLRRFTRPRLWRDELRKLSDTHKRDPFLIGRTRCRAFSRRRAEAENRHVGMGPFTLSRCTWLQGLSLHGIYVGITGLRGGSSNTIGVNPPGRRELLFLSNWLQCRRRRSASSIFPI